jgi:predicted nucleotidyltransferase
MRATLLDLSQRSELSLHGSIVADVGAAARALGIETLIVGAFARDIQLLYRYGIDTQRRTEDVDIALAVPDWVTFEALKVRMIQSAAFRPSPTSAHRLRHRSDLPIDLVPFGRIETRHRKIAWPPHGEVEMDVFGFREVLAAAQEVVLPGDARTEVVSLTGLALLKIICWKDRHYQSPRKDAQDLILIIRNYLQAGNEDRLWREFLHWSQEDNFDHEVAGARMLGHDIRLLLDEDGLRKVSGILSEESAPETPGLLPNEMIVHDPDKARALLESMLRGLLEN